MTDARSTGVQPAGRTKKLIAFRADQVSAVDRIATEAGTSFTSVVLEAVDAHIAAHDSATQQILRRIVQQNAGLLERLRDA
ncbi:hypothetical protein P5G50_15235 [Leifsonia sp. F6_8S_P_1B]|uniref:CopG family transcriptional regulator n=1 Tax=Leifsonia williamsii TaxID=3035919 RepID=A0ABT8KEC5_9MICO|nr:hypothetical protein [Leifsonia williamsii]MDN4615805.1 hypothetical protein [Leifsonia williamsii]